LFSRVIRSFLVASLGASLAAQVFAGQAAHAGSVTSGGGPGNAGTGLNPSPAAGPALAQNAAAGSAQTGTEEQARSPKCIAFGGVTSQLTPVDLYPMAGQCIQDNDFADGLAFFALAGMDIRYDNSRVNDKTTGDTGSVLLMQTFQRLPAAAKNRFGDVISAVSADNSAKEYLCRWAQEVGPPAYYPEYMIMHGMNAVTAGLTKTPLPQELLPVTDPKGTWKTIITGYLHCSLTEPSDSRHDAEAAGRYRKTVENAPVTSQTQSAAQPGQASHPPVTPMSSQSTSTNGDQATSDQQSPNYGPLTFNRDGADFYFAQDGKFAPASVNDGTIEIHLHASSFQIGYNGRQMNICLAPIPFEEVRADPTGYKASCLSGAMSGARAPHSDALLVYSGSKWNDGNSALTDETSMKATPMKGFKSAYQVNQLLFVQAPDKSLGSFRGTLYGYIVVYKQGERSNKDIMPIHLILQ
jgi:hypothetical protein